MLLFKTKPLRNGRATFYQTVERSSLTLPPECYCPPARAWRVGVVVSGRGTEANRKPQEHFTWAQSLFPCAWLKVHGANYTTSPGTPARPTARLLSCSWPRCSVRLQLCRSCCKPLFPRSSRTCGSSGACDSSVIPLWATSLTYSTAAAKLEAVPWQTV